jgi:hypothetical protein
MRKPSVAAWAVNQLVRTQRRALKSLFDSGDALQRAQSKLLAGRGEAGALRDTADRERAAVEQLAKTARGLLSSEGRELTPATLERVSDTLHAAALDKDARAKVQEGCLDQELRHVGLGAGGSVPPRASARSAPKKPSNRKDAPDRKRAERVRAARKAEADARRAAERAARELKAAEERRERTAKALEEAEATVRAARQRAQETAREHQRAQRELDRA